MSSSEKIPVSEFPIESIHDIRPDFDSDDSSSEIQDGRDRDGIHDSASDERAGRISSGESSHDCITERIRGRAER